MILHKPELFASSCSATLSVHKRCFLGGFPLVGGRLVICIGTKLTTEESLQEYIPKCSPLKS